MLTLIKSKLHNIISLSSINIMLAVMPLLLIPYLVRVLGIENFGVIAIGQALLAYIAISTEYGFNYMGTQQVAKVTGDATKLERVFFDIIWSKLILFISSLFIFTIIILSGIFNDEFTKLYLIFVLSGIYYVLTPGWFFLGVERHRFYVVSMFFSKLTLITLTLIFIETPLDLELYVYIFFIVNVVYSVIVFIYVIYSFNLKFQFLEIKAFFRQMKLGFNIFVSAIASSLYTIFIPLFLGASFSLTEVGVFSAAEKLIRGISSFASPLVMAFFPAASKGGDAGIDGKPLISVVLIITTIGILITALTSLSAENLILIMYGDSVEIGPIVSIFQDLSPIIMFVFISNAVGLLYFVGRGRTMLYMIIVIVGSVLSTATLPILVDQYGLSGATYAIILAEALIALLFVYKMFMNEKSHNL